MATQIEETLKRIQTSDGVIGFVIVNNAGIPIKSNMDDAMSIRYAGLVLQLIATSQVAIKKDDPTDKLTYLRLRTKHNEILVIPGKMLVQVKDALDRREILGDLVYWNTTSLNNYKHYTMVVIQKPTGSRSPM